MRLMDFRWVNGFPGIYIRGATAVERAVRQAYRFGRKVDPQLGPRVPVRGPYMADSQL